MSHSYVNLYINTLDGQRPATMHTLQLKLTVEKLLDIWHFLASLKHFHGRFMIAHD